MIEKKCVLIAIIDLLLPQFNIHLMAIHLLMA